MRSHKIQNIYTGIYLCFNLCILMSDDGYDKIYSLTAIGLTAGGSSTVHFTHKQYTEQHDETQYLERNMHNNKNT